MGYRKYTKIDEDELKRLHAKGLSDGKIAEELDASQTGVSRARQRLGLEPNFEFPGNPEGDPKQFYEDSKARARQWKEDNPKATKKQFAQWQKDHRKQRNKYMIKWRNKKYSKLPYVDQMGKGKSQKRG